MVADAASVRPAIRSTAGSSPFRIAKPPGRTDSGSSPLIRSVSASVPKRSRWVGPTLVTIAASAAAIAQSRRISASE